jgi:hypothetical protein
MIAVYDRLRSKGASRKIALALRRHRSQINPTRCSAEVSKAIRLISLGVHHGSSLPPGYTH